MRYFLLTILPIVALSAAEVTATWYGWAMFALTTIIVLSQVNFKKMSENIKNLFGDDSDTDGKIKID